MQVAYKRRLRAMVAKLPAWVTEGILSASRGIGGERALLCRVRRR